MENLINKSPIFLVVLLLVLGFVLLIKGADYFVEGSSSIAKRFKVPSIIIGLTVVAMGTSLPETAVSVTASITNNNELAVSNAIGSNIFNLMVVIGVCAVMTPVLVDIQTIKKDIPFSAICAIILLILGILGLCDQSSFVLGHIDGIIMLVIFVFYLLIMVKKALSAIRNGKNAEESNEEQKGISLAKSLIYVLLGAAAIAIGGDMTVDTASRIASELGMSQTLIGLTIVSIGTSLPELVTSIVAAQKKEIGMALGNAIGSNIFNILMVLGIASAISPIAFITENIIDIVILIAFTLIVWILAATKKKLDKWEGGLMLALYAFYAVYIFVR